MVGKEFVYSSVYSIIPRLKLTRIAFTSSIFVPLLAMIFKREVFSSISTAIKCGPVKAGFNCAERPLRLPGTDLTKKYCLFGCVGVEEVGVVEIVSPLPV